MASAQVHTVFDLFGPTEQIAVQRGLAEFRAGRPVLFAADDALIAMPVDGAVSLQEFRQMRSAAPLRLAITARRAHALGIEADGAVAVRLSGAEDLAKLLSLSADARVAQPLDAVPAGPAAAAAIDLAKLAERLPALLVMDPAWGRAANPGSLVRVEAEAVARFRQHLADSLSIAATSLLPLDGMTALLVVFRDAIGGTPAALMVGEPDFSGPVLVRLHSACLTGDVFGSRRCDCGDQLKLAIARVAEAGGIILYLHQEGRGLGLANKTRAYRLQDLGLDTVDANVTLGFEDDERDYRVAARMLQLLGCRRVMLLTNNPAKLAGLAAAGIEICGRMPLQAPVKPENRRYLTARAVRAGHCLDDLWKS